MNTQRTKTVARSQPERHNLGEMGASVSDPSGSRLLHSSPVPSSLSLRWASRRPSSSFQDWHPASGVRRPLQSSPVRRPAPAFTLIELMVVISIIAILLGIIVPTYFSSREKAKYTKAKVTVKNLETAFKAYLDHYRVWPGAINDGNNHEIQGNVFLLLQGRVGADNSEDYTFYEFESTNTANGALDPWSYPWDSTTWKAYRVRVDDDYDNQITVGGQTIYRSVLVWSVGTNRSDPIGEPATKAGNIKSWE